MGRRTLYVALCVVGCPAVEVPRRPMVSGRAVDRHGAVSGESERVTPWQRGRDRTEIDPAALVRLVTVVAAATISE